MSRRGEDHPQALRADARRNRAALVAAARRALTTQGSAASLDGIARDAGVGIGTLYRHFPTRHALLEAVYAVELDAVVDNANDSLEHQTADVALREWVARYADFTARSRGMMETLRAGLAEGRIPSSTTHDRITAAIAPLLAAGAADGSLRDDVAAEDVTTLLLGTFLATATSPTPSSTPRLLALVLDALRPTPS